MTHMNDLFLGFGCGLYSYFLYTYGKLVWWPDGSLAAALKKVHVDRAWKVFGLCVSFLPVYTSFSNLENDTQISAYLGAVGIAYAAFKNPDSYFLSLIVICLLPFSSILASFHLNELLGWNVSKDHFLAGLQLIFTVGLVISGVEYYKSSVRPK